MRISDWSSDVCSSDLAQIIDGRDRRDRLGQRRHFRRRRQARAEHGILEVADFLPANDGDAAPDDEYIVFGQLHQLLREHQRAALFGNRLASIGEQSMYRQGPAFRILTKIAEARSEEHTSELQSLMRKSYAVFFLKQKNRN